jgi:hypothetical protein
MNYTKNNHLYYTIGGRKFGIRETPYEKYKVYAGSIDKKEYKKSSWRNELKKTARSVLNDYGKDLILFLSGGTDSEIVLRNFLEIGFKPKCVTIKFTDDYNSIDVKQAIDIANELNVKLDTINFDIKKFYRSGEALEFSKEINCTQITYLMVYYHIKNFNMPAVMGGEQLLSRKVLPTGSFWYHCFRENEDASAMRFSEKYNIPIVNEWFSYTPEMMLYYLEDPDIQKLITDKFNYKLTSVSSKNYILKKLYPEIKLRIKTHGFERLLGFNGEVYRKLSTFQTKRLTTCLDGIPIDQLINHLKGLT